MKKSVVAFLILLLATSCFKKDKFSSTPKITFESFTILGDSAKVVFSFEDGEGDIGLTSSETNSPYNIESKYYYNLYLEYYEKKDNGGWKPGLDLNGDTIVFKNRLLPIYTGKAKSISGTIEYTIEPLYFNQFSLESDTIKYRIQVIDRALNESNWIETNEIVH